MDDATFHKIMAEVKEAEGYEDGRRMAIMAECADKLKADFSRRYRIEMTTHSEILNYCGLRIVVVENPLREMKDNVE
jgi:hypothetical protein